jgi:lysozyme
MDREALKRQLRVDEAEREFPYDDATGRTLAKGDTLRGNLTIGVGRNLSGKPLRASERDFMLDNDVREVEDALDKALPWWRQMSDRRQQALANMCFNLGLEKLLTFKNTLAYMQAGRYDAAADGMEHSLWASQVGARADRLIKMMRDG